MVDKNLEEYVNNFLVGDYKLNWINYYIVVATNIHCSTQTIFVKFENEVLVYAGDDFLGKISIKKEEKDN